MSMTMQDWADVASKRYPQKPRKPRKAPDPMLYLAIVGILASISALVMVFYLIQHANDHLPDRHHVNSLFRS